jgi:tripartite-type tricarboxylate transporter receptor subunit TctC
MTSFRAALLAVLMGLAGFVHAQSFPSKPIHIVVPFVPGGGGDFVARLIAEKMAKDWGQPVLIDNRPGASGNIGAEFVAKAPADGYTLLLAASTLAINPSLYRDTPYNALTDFAPITQTTLMPNILVANPAVPVKTVDDLVKLAKAEPGKIVFGSSGIGTGADMAGKLLVLQADVNALHVPYGRGGASMMTDLLGGRVAVTFASLPTVIAFIQAGKLRPLGIASAERWPGLSAVPTIAESGFPDFEMSTWMGLLAPAGTPKDVVDKLYVEVTRVLQDPDVRQRSLAGGVIAPADNTPEQFGRFIQSELSKYSDIVKRAGIPVQ